MKPIRIVSPLALGLIVLLIAGNATGYVLLSPNRTWDCPPTYIVDQTGIASITDGDGGVSKVIAAITSVSSASDAWNDAGAARVVYARKGSTANFVLGDGVPMIKFDDPFDECTFPCLAATYHLYFSERAAGASSWKIYDADIVTNLDFEWTSEGEDPGGFDCSGEYYIEGVMVHEIGHGLGLDHASDFLATMYPFAYPCNNVMATTATDDENALLALYGTAPCTNAPFQPCSAYTQYLTGTGNSDFQPCNGSFSMSGSGTIKGWVQGPSGTDFDLYLDKSTPYGWWINVASATSSSSSDSITYSGTAGTYRFRVVSYSGSGTYHFWYQRPFFLL
jgi:hypothetical protein